AFTVLQLADKLRDEADAYKFLEDLRWHGEPVCAHCGADRPYYLKPRDGERRTRTGSGSQRRVWKCRACRKQFSVLTGTIFHGTKIPVRSWVFRDLRKCARQRTASAPARSSASTT